MKIGSYSIGVRYNWKYTWFKYLLPKETQNVYRNGKLIVPHQYFERGIWWLGFFFYKARTCRVCGAQMCINGGLIETIHGSLKTTEVIGVVCKHCAKESPYITDIQKRIYKESCEICTNEKCKWSKTKEEKDYEL